MKKIILSPQMLFQMRSLESSLTMLLVIRTPIVNSSPVSMKCPYCLQHIRSEIISKPEFVSIVLGMTLFIVVPGLIMMGLVILLMQMTANKKHRCPLCERELGHDGKFLIYFQDEVYSLAIFSSGLIVTKKILISGVLMILAIIIFSVKLSSVESEKWVDVTWK